MLKRPKPGEDEDDILRMQEEYLREKGKNTSMQPAAQVVDMRKTSKRSHEVNDPAPSGTRKPSKYAASKGLKTHEKKARSSNVLMGDILEKYTETPTPEEMQKNIDENDKVYFPKVIPSLLGNVVEKNIDNFEDFTFPMPSKGFPEVKKRDPNAPKKLKIKAESKMEVDEPSTSSSSTGVYMPLNIPQKSYILSTKDADEIHQENVSVLSKLSESEILAEQNKLLTSLDPKLIEFLKLKRKLQGNSEKQSNLPKVQTTNIPKIDEVDTTVSQPEVTNIDNDLWENDVLSHPNVNQWLHFDSLEKDKLEWMKGVKESQLKSDEPYEARFDFKGYLLPYSVEYTEQTKTLFHHGDEPHRPGYSLTELFELSRSTVTQQRVVALNTIAGILEYASAGTYKDIIDIPLSKIFFIVRIAMDENKVILLEPALKAMRNLLYNRIDEACLDALLGFEEGTQQPCLENNKSEIEELESKESDLKDFHLAEIDIITMTLRTEILQRIFYILENIRPSFNCVQYCLQILTRLSRDSVDTAKRIIETEHLMSIVIRNFIPVTSINFAFDPQIVYNGKPIIAALKLMRVLSLQSFETTHVLVNKYEILKPVSEYLSSGVDGTYGLRIQIEAFAILSNVLYFGVGVDTAKSLCPIIVTSLYKHVKGTDVIVDSSVISATHAAVLLQCVNRILCSNMQNIDSYKHQIYPLLKEGVQKWLAQLAMSDSYTCGHLRLLCSALDCCKSILIIENIPIKFLIDSLKKLAISKGYKELVNHLLPSSNLVSPKESKDLYLVKNLMSLGASVIDRAQKVLPVLSVQSPLPFLASLFKVLELLNEPEISRAFVEPLTGYLTKLENVVPSLCDNWFTRIETDFVFSVVKVAMNDNIAEDSKDLLYAVANKLCYILRMDKNRELYFIFNEIVFNNKWFTAERLMNIVSISESSAFSKVLTSIEQVKQCYEKVVNLEYDYMGPNMVLRKWQEPILPRDWIYLPILNLYSECQGVDDNKSQEPAWLKGAEKEFTITCSLEWILFNELCFPELLKDIDITDRFCRIMCVFLCDNSLFLDIKVKTILHNCVQTIFKLEKKKPFNFDKPLTGLHNFQDFYTQLLEQFQSVSYGDRTFAACVLVPLAQKHNVKWRKLLWSEYAGCLRALDCPEDLLCYDVKDYFYPEETDESVIKSYFQALSGNLLRANTLSHQIASHHVKCYKNRPK